MVPEGTGRDGCSARDDARALLLFAVLVLLFGAAFWGAGPLLGEPTALTRAVLPASALMVVCPAAAAWIVAARQGAAADLVHRPRPVRVGARWWVLTVGVMPTVLALEAVAGGRAPVAGVAPVTVPALCAVYLLAATAEEIGWTAFALPRLLRFAGPVAGGAVIGAFWSLWHVVPWAQLGHGPGWIAGQALFSVALRVLLVLLTVRSGAWLWPAVVCHASSNVAWSLSQGAGALYDPWVAAALAGLAVPLVRAVPPGP